MRRTLEISSIGIALAFIPCRAFADEFATTIAPTAPAPAPAPAPPAKPADPLAGTSGSTTADPKREPEHPLSVTMEVEDKTAPRIPYRNGDPIPQGYRVESSPRLGIVAGGAVMAGTLWTISTIAAIALDKQDPVNGDPNFGSNYWPMFIPIIGPFLTIGTADSSGTGAAILALDGVVQTAGLAMVIAGIAAPKLELVPQKALTIGPRAQNGGATFEIGGKF